MPLEPVTGVTLDLLNAETVQTATNLGLDSSFLQQLLNSLIKIGGDQFGPILVQLLVDLLNKGGSSGGDLQSLLTNLINQYGPILIQKYGPMLMEKLAPVLVDVVIKLLQSSLGNK